MDDNESLLSPKEDGHWFFKKNTFTLEEVDQPIHDSKYDLQDVQEEMKEEHCRLFSFIKADEDERELAKFIDQVERNIK